MHGNVWYVTMQDPFIAINCSPLAGAKILEDWSVRRLEATVGVSAVYTITLQTLQYMIRGISDQYTIIAICLSEASVLEHKARGFFSQSSVGVFSLSSASISLLAFHKD